MWEGGVDEALWGLRHLDAGADDARGVQRGQGPRAGGTVRRAGTGCLAYEPIHGRGKTPFPRLAQDAGADRLADGVFGTFGLAAGGMTMIARFLTAPSHWRTRDFLGLLALHQGTSDA